MTILPLTFSCQERETPYTTWTAYNGDTGSSSYSALDQINRDTVEDLEVAWIYNSGDQDDIDFAFAASQANPIIIGRTLYITTPALKVVAIDAGTGEELWRFDPFRDGRAAGVNRGVMYWEDGSDRRILFSAGSNLYALEAGTGELVQEFGEGGSVDLREGLGRDPGLISVSASSPGVIHKDLVIMGSTVSEGTSAAPGHIRAYNVRSGEMAWIFHTVPQPGEEGYETWAPNAWQQAGGANNWAGMSLDSEREVVYVPTGSAAPDFYTPGTRGDGSHLYANTILALDATTGEKIWHYQVLPHDLWDYDLPAPPNLVTVEIDGDRVDALAQVTKQGYVFVLDRETGDPLFPIEERPVPQSHIEGEETWPTQKFPVKPEPFVRQVLTEEDLTNRTPEAREYALERFREMNYEGIYTPIGTRPTLFYPGTRGGANWGGASFDPETGMLYVNANEIGNIFSLREVKEPVSGPVTAAARGERLYLATCSSCHGSPGRREPSQFPSLANVSGRISAEVIEEVIVNGRGIMPPFPQLTSEERDAIIEYLFAVNEEGELPPAEDIPADGELVTVGHAVDVAYQLFLDQEGYPATSPPWGSLNAIDLNSGALVWKVPLGEYEELTAQGVPITGTQNLGGSMVTAGGLIFIAAAEDERFRAFDKETGEVLWDFRLPGGGHATPATYLVDGRQYIAIAAAGGSRVGTPKGDAYIAFRLPE